MKQLSILIVDDERPARDLIKNHLSGIDWINILGESSDVDQALSIILKSKPDVILLDIQMPVKDGFHLVEKLLGHKVQTEIIFITAYVKYAVQAIKASAFDYLLKPVKKSELILSLSRLRERMEFSRIEDRFASLIDHLSENKKIKFKHRTGFSMVDPENIIFCRADSNYTIIELNENRNMLVSMNLGKVEESLPQSTFCRISRSLIVNLKYIVHVDRKAMTCTLNNGQVHTMNISRKYFRDLELHCDHLFKMK